MTSTEALEVEEIPEDLLVIGGGYIGMELGSVYANLGSKVVVVEALPGILTGADPDLVRPVLTIRARRISANCASTPRSRRCPPKGKKSASSPQGPDKVEKEEFYDRVLVSVGRVPRLRGSGLGKHQGRAGRARLHQGQRQAGNRRSLYPGHWRYCRAAFCWRTRRPRKRASPSKPLRASRALRRASSFPPWSSPIRNWPGAALTEAEAKSKGLEFEVAKFPWGASGRALTFDRPDGLTKLIIDPETERVMGVGMVGHGAGELIAEGVVAIEMGATVRDLAESVHPHPTLSETIMEAAEVFYGVSTHTYSPRKKEE